MLQKYHITILKGISMKNNMCYDIHSQSEFKKLHLKKKTDEKEKKNTNM